MARRPRDDAPGISHHVMIRGIDGRLVFRRARERLDLLKRLDALLPEAGARCLAWAIQPSHLHLVVQTGDVPLSRVMQRLNVGFARVFNLRRDRRGYVFQDRFKSRPIRDDADLMGVTRYVHRNPLQDGLVDGLRRLEVYPWCGYSALMGTREARPFESVGELLALYADDRAEARRRLRSWMAAEGEEVARPAEPAPAIEAAAPALPAAGRTARVASLPALIARVCVELGVAPEDLASRSRRRDLAAARAAIAYLAVCRFGIPGAEVARALGVGRSAVSQSLERGREVAKAQLNY